MNQSKDTFCAVPAKSRIVKIFCAGDSPTKILRPRKTESKNLILPMSSFSITSPLLRKTRQNKGNRAVSSNSKKCVWYNSSMDKHELALRRSHLVPVLPTYCHHYFSKRNGDGVYECMRDGVYWCKGCYQPENEDRPLCARHRVCEVCGSKATEKIVYEAV